MVGVNHYTYNYERKTNSLKMNIGLVRKLGERVRRSELGLSIYIYTW